MSIFVCGDTHGNIDSWKLTRRYWDIQADLTKDDYLIILGDFGYLWSDPPDRKEKRQLDILANRKFTTLFIDGNHENFNLINALPEVDMFDGKVGDLGNGIYHLKRGYVYTIEGLKFWCFGGGTSIDKHWRELDVSWWPQELPTQGEMDFGISQLEKHNWTVDYVLTHAAPRSVVALIGYTEKMECPLSMWFESLKYKIQCKKWHFGHYHEDRTLEGKYYCHYSSEPYWIK